MFEQQRGLKNVTPGFRLIHRDKKVVFDLESGLVYLLDGDRNREPSIINLGSRETELLKLLIKRNGMIVSKNEIIDVVWKGRVVCENAAAVILSNIRKVIRRVDSKCSCLVTISRKGYIFYPHRSDLYVEMIDEVGDYVQP